MLFFKKKEDSVPIVDYCYKMSNGRHRTNAYRRRYRRLGRLLESYQEEIHKQISSKDVDEEMVLNFLHFIKGLTPSKGKQAYCLNSVKAFYTLFVTMMNRIKKDGYKVNNEFGIRIPDEDAGMVYLNMDELKKIFDLKLRSEQAQIRDIFLIGCFTALRYSDYSRLTEDNFIGGKITILTKKTDTQVVIPIHHIITSIIERNNGYDFLKYRNSQQNFNKVIKNVCKKAGIVDKIMFERTEGFKKVKRIYKKYELVSSHTARRTGATNMYIAGIAPFRIMLLTGHKTESAFYKYIRIRKEENARDLAENPFFKGE